MEQDIEVTHLLIPIEEVEKISKLEGVSIAWLEWVGEGVNLSDEAIEQEAKINSSIEDIQTGYKQALKDLKDLFKI